MVSAAPKLSIRLSSYTTIHTLVLKQLAIKTLIPFSELYCALNRVCYAVEIRLHCTYTCTPYSRTSARKTWSSLLEAA